MHSATATTTTATLCSCTLPPRQKSVGGIKQTNVKNWRIRVCICMHCAIICFLCFTCTSRGAGTGSGFGGQRGRIIWILCQPKSALLMLCSPSVVFSRNHAAIYIYLFIFNVSFPADACTGVMAWLRDGARACTLQQARHSKLRRSWLTNSRQSRCVSIDTARTVRQTEGERDGVRAGGLFIDLQWRLRWVRLAVDCY